MKQIFTIILILLVSIPIVAQEENIVATPETTTYYFIRHAEKDRSDASNKDPHLMQKGVFRAAKWSYILEHVKFDAVYSTNYSRTKQTAQPTAEKNNLEISIYDPDSLNSEDFIRDTKGKSVLVVGHSNTTPAFVNLVIGKEKYEDIDDNNNSNLYIVTISSSGGVSDSLLIIE
jgi:2,3-bisphosphoglycerate-dependent phosphoglycerate mutase